MHFIGMDIHKNYSSVAVTNEFAGQVVGAIHKLPYNSGGQNDK
jgi:hypothetical protein